MQVECFIPRLKRFSFVKILFYLVEIVNCPWYFCLTLFTYHHPTIFTLLFFPYLLSNFPTLSYCQCEQGSCKKISKMATKALKSRQRVLNLIMSTHRAHFQTNKKLNNVYIKTIEKLTLEFHLQIAKNVTKIFYIPEKKLHNSLLHNSFKNCQNVVKPPNLVSLLVVLMYYLLLHVPSHNLPRIYLPVVQTSYKHLYLFVHLSAGPFVCLVFTILSICLSVVNKLWSMSVNHAWKSNYICYCFFCFSFSFKR